ncbi:prestin-like isoform X1 [Haliotis asinina]|uniref:prestin-like isoform X1 n=2 Tax=Haliotis asinina TaxID=109174 RepID=UPI003532321C
MALLARGADDNTNTILLRAATHRCSAMSSKADATPSDVKSTESSEGGKKKMIGQEDELRNSLIGEERMVVERPIYNQVEFDKGFESGKRPVTLPHTWAKKKVNKFSCSGKCVGKFITSLFPFLSILRGYSIRHDLVADIIAGLTVGIMHIPQGMAYGQLSTLPPVFGLYVSFFPVFIYFFFGTSKHISIGTFAVVSLMVGSVVDKAMTSKGFTSDQLEAASKTEATTLAPMLFNMSSGNVTFGNGTNGTNTGGDTEMDALILSTKLKIAMAVTFGIGCIQLLMGLCRLGFVTVYLSDPLVSGFTTGAACHVFTSQIKHIFGVQMGRYYGPLKLVWSYRDFFMNIPQTNAVTLIASIICILMLAVVKECINNNPKVKPKLKMPVPIELIVVVLGTVISQFAYLNTNFGVQIVGDIPVGIPPPKAQQFEFLPDVVSDAVAVGIVAFAISVSMAKILAKKHDYEVDSNQELLAYGIVNIFSSFFSSFCASASLSRSLVQEGVGGRTQVAGLFSSALLLIVLLLVGPYFASLPNCVLAAIIIVALKGMFKQFLELKRLWKISVVDFMVWLVTWFATVLLDVDLGLGVGVGFALLTVIVRSQRPYACLMGHVPGTDLYRDIKAYKAATEISGIKIYRFDSALFFANTEHFKQTVYKLAADPKVLKKNIKKAKKLQRKQADSETQIVKETTNNSTDVHLRISSENVSESPMRGSEVHTVIIDCSTMSYVDSVGVKVMGQVINELKDVNVSVLLAHCKVDVREMFEKTGFFKTNDKEQVFVTVHDAVLSAQRKALPSNGNIKNGRASTTTKAVEEIADYDNGNSADAENFQLDSMRAPLADATRL